MLLVLFLFGGIGFFLTGTPSSSIAKSTVAREALPSNAVTETGYYTDADGAKNAAVEDELEKMKKEMGL